jgi:hypothetical protein
MKVIARYNEDVSWATQPFEIVQKGEHLPNEGREASSYLWWIIENYDKLPDEVHFLQANPFDHVDKDLNIIWWAESDKHGNPHHNGLRIGELAGILDLDLPIAWKFPAGACFKVSKEEIKKYSLDWYKEAYKQSMEFPQAAWIFERLWSVIYKIWN